MKHILKVLVGSKAHGLDTSNSDVDYRHIFVIPTSEILKIGGMSTKTIQGTDGVLDDTQYELGHFLQLACKSNPSVLEIFGAPILGSTEEGDALRELFPFVWNSQDVKNAFLGYSNQQRQKMFDKSLPEGRLRKFAAAYIRVLLQGSILLEEEKLLIRIDDPVWNAALRNVKTGGTTFGEIVDIAERLEKRLKHAFDCNPEHRTNMEKINEYLLDVRRQNW